MSRLYRDPAIRAIAGGVVLVLVVLGWAATLILLAESMWADAL